MRPGTGSQRAGLLPGLVPGQKPETDIGFDSPSWPGPFSLEPVSPMKSAGSATITFWLPSCPTPRRKARRSSRTASATWSNERPRGPLAVVYSYPGNLLTTEDADFSASSSRSRSDRFDDNNHHNGAGGGRIHAASERGKGSPRHAPTVFRSVTGTLLMQRSRILPDLADIEAFGSDAGPGPRPGR